MAERFGRVVGSPWQQEIDEDIPIIYRSIRELCRDTDNLNEEISQLAGDVVHLADGMTKLVQQLTINLAKQNE